MTNKIGYPDKWRDYSGLSLRPGTFLVNVLAAQQFETGRQFRRLDGLVDRTEWGMTRPPSTRTSIRQRPDRLSRRHPAAAVFRRVGGRASNYGGIGAVIGHEMLHAFDDNGRHFDARGNMRECGRPRTRPIFERRADLVVGQYGSYVASTPPASTAG